MAFEKLIEWVYKHINRYRGLPFEVRMVLFFIVIVIPLAILGFLYWLFSGMFGSGVPAIVATGVFVFSVVVLIVLVFTFHGWRKRRKERALEGLIGSGESAGPVKVDVREKIRANNSKFVTAVRELKKKTALSVYDRPWQIVIGDSGCGKTRLINESGLEFPLGRPEGHQLGTLNYNWWFSDDLIFIDMAGKLVNPQDDEDHEEWLGFLRTLSRYRPRCPINGALVCVSVTDLLGAKPEEIRESADNMLKRLRELQFHLGVTFPVYLLATKCDLIVGFLEFFQRIGKNLAVRQQIGGWSRPGNFDAPYDPDQFAADFESVYQRLHNLRLRRLNERGDDAAALETAYCFPEEFRELREPLQVYVSTLFPAQRQRKGVKNLLFRGLYFSSATQEGKLVTRHLSQQLGEEAARIFEQLERVVHDKPEPHFLKDLLLKKVAPEEGLVFRDQAQLQRNRRLMSMLAVGSAAMLILAAIGLWFSWNALQGAIQKPREHAQAAAHAALVASDSNSRPADGRALELAGLLLDDAEQLRRKMGWLRLLSLAINPEAPIRHLQRIAAGVFEHRLMPRAHEQIALGLRVEAPLATGSDEDAEQEERDPAIRAERLAGRAAYFDALVAYCRWFGVSGSADGSRWAACATPDGLLAMARVSRAPGASANVAGGATLAEWSAQRTPPEGERAASPDKVITTQAALARDPTRYTFGELATAYLHVVADNSQRSGGKLSNPAQAFGDAAVRDAALARYFEALRPWAELRPPSWEGDEELERVVRLLRACAQVDAAYNDVLKLAAETPQTEPAAFQQQAERVEQVLQSAVAAFAACAERAGDARGGDLLAQLNQYRQRHWFEKRASLRDALACGGGAANELVLCEADAALGKTLAGWGMLDPAKSHGLSCGQPWQGDAIGFNKFPGGFAHLITSAAEGTGAGPRAWMLSAEARTMREHVTKLAALLNPTGAPPETLAAWGELLEAHLNQAGARKIGAPDPTDYAERWKPAELRDATSVVLGLATAGAGSHHLRQLAKFLSDEPEWGLAALRGVAAGAADSQRTPIATNDVLSATLREGVKLVSLLDRFRSEKSAYIPPAGGEADPTTVAADRVRVLWERYVGKYAGEWKSITEDWKSESPPAGASDWKWWQSNFDGKPPTETAAQVREFAIHVAGAGYRAPEGWPANDSVSESFNRVLWDGLRKSFDGLQRPATRTALGPEQVVADEFAGCWSRLRTGVSAAATELLGGGDSRDDHALFRPESVVGLIDSLAPFRSLSAYADAACRAFASQAGRKLAEDLAKVKAAPADCPLAATLVARYQRVAERVQKGCGVALDLAALLEAQRCCGALAKLTGGSFRVRLLLRDDLAQYGRPDVANAANVSDIDCFETLTFNFGGSSREWTTKTEAFELPVGPAGSATLAVDGKRHGAGSNVRVVDFKADALRSALSRNWQTGPSGPGWVVVIECPCTDRKAYVGLLFQPQGFEREDFEKAAGCGGG
ncbi:MAG: type VI secretion protein IcmF/TssM N-terminal domain-containing protein [Phycisphaerae bacterium]